jgi:hypothetical protein
VRQSHGPPAALRQSFSRARARNNNVNEITNFPDTPTLAAAHSKRDPTLLLFFAARIRCWGRHRALARARSRSSSRLDRVLASHNKLLPSDPRQRCPSPAARPPLTQSRPDGLAPPPTASRRRHGRCALLAAKDVPVTVASSVGRLTLPCPSARSAHAPSLHPRLLLRFAWPQ